MKRILHIVPALAFLAAAPAQEPPPAPEVPAGRVDAAVERLRSGEPDAETLAGILPLLADPTARARIRDEILLADPFPASALVASLDHAELAARLAALELLEEKAGGDFEFDPWLEPGDPDNAGPLARWRKWAAEDHDSDGTPEGDLLTDAQRRGYLRDLLAEDTDKAARARHMLEADGLGAVGFLEEFLASSPALPAGGRARIRQAQYQIVLSRPFGDQAAATARHLAFGSRDQTLSALDSLRGAGLAALPIVRDFLDHQDPLVRESAIDAMLAAGGARAVETVTPALEKETDVNVIHGALRRLKDVPGNDATRLAAGFLTHDDEDLLVSAIRTCLSLVGGGRSDPFSSSSGPTPTASGLTAEVHDRVLALLDDPRWRVRTAALEFVADRRIAEAEDKVIELLEDPDEFVRFRAIKAAAAISSEAAPPELKRLFLADPGMVGPVLEGYAALDLEPDDEMLAALEEFPPDARLAAIGAAKADADLASVVLRFADDDNLDVACAALRFLAADAERVASAEVASVLLAALRADSPEKQRAVLDRLRLPATGGIDPAVAEVLSKYATPSETTHLDPLYDAFLHPEGGTPSGERATPSIPGAASKLVDALMTIAAGEEDDWFRAALPLARAGKPEALKLLTERLPELSTARKAAVAEELSEPTQREALELLRRLLREPVPEIRSAAAAAALSNEAAPAFTAMALEELLRPGTELRAHELYSYRFESIIRSGAARRVARNWALEVVEDRAAPAPARVLGLLALRRSLPFSARETLAGLAASSPDRWIRRAAWHALGTAAPTDFTGSLDALLADDSPQVRAVLPEVTGTMDSRWGHRFDDVNRVQDSAWYSDRDERHLGETAEEALREMAGTDPSAENRFEAAFALLSHGREIDIDAMAELVGRQPEEAQASRRLAAWMSENTSRLGPGLAPLVSALDTSSVPPDEVQEIAGSIGGSREGAGFASFSGLVASAEAARDAPQQTGEPESGDQPVEREHLRLVYFFKPGCRECARVSDLIDTLRRDFPLLEVTEHNILESDGTVLNQALSDRFGVPSGQQNIAPAVFTQAGFLVDENITAPAFGKLLSTTMETPENPDWNRVGEPELEAAGERVEERFDSLTLPVVLAAGLLDGVNPCAFATIVFFLSYLQIARRTPREMLMVGAAFILAVFLAYLAAGLALHRVLAELTEHVRGIQRWLNWVFGLLALAAAVLSFRDARIARRGRPEDMTLQLPVFLKDRIRGVVRTGARARRFVIAAFLAGIVISFLELACTGQVYAPIIYRIQQGSANAVGLLLLYNLAFILPLVAIFLAAWAGLRSETLLRFQKRSTVTVKILLGLLFLGLAVLMILGDRVLPH